MQFYLTSQIVQGVSTRKMVVQEKHHQDLVDSHLKNDKKHRLKQRFDVKKKLGQGTYGKVQLAVNRETGQEVAIKTIKKVKIENEQDLIRIRREIQIMSSIQHPHLIHIYEVFENKDKIVLIMQFASGGELYDYLSEKKVLNDTEARRIFRQIATAVYYCHKNKICHRDLKLENILLDEKGNAKIADFGLSNVFDERHLLNTYCGSPLYASPEIVKGVPYYGPEVDCWSMGVLLYTLVYGAMPFDGSNFKKLVTQISEGDYFEPKKKSKASTLIRKLLTVDPIKRATIVDICTDWWVNQGYEHSLLQVAEDMANLTPVRLDLLLALAPGSPIPPDEAEFKDGDGETFLDNALAERDTQDEDEDDEDNIETAANSFAYVKGSRASNFSASSPNLLDINEKPYKEEDEDDEFLPADVAAALQGQCAKRELSFDGSLMRISSLAHQRKKPRKSESSAIASNIQEEPRNEKTVKEQCEESVKENSIPDKQHTSSKTQVKEVTEKVQNVKTSSSSSKGNQLRTEIKENSEVGTKEIIPKLASKSEVSKETGKEMLPEEQKEETVSQKQNKKESQMSSDKKVPTKVSSGLAQRRSSFPAQDEISSNESKRVGRPPGKIIIPKTFDSPQSSPSPKFQVVKRGSLTPSDTQKVSTEAEVRTAAANDLEIQQDSEKLSGSSAKEEARSGNKESEKPEDSIANDNIGKKETDDGKKVLAKGILKKGIAKAKLVERKMSQQSSFESDVATPPSTASVETPEIVPSFFKTPKPYGKEEQPQQLKSDAQIVLTKAQEDKTVDAILSNQRESIWDTPVPTNSINNNKQVKQPQNKKSEWCALSSTLDSEMSGWREQMEESLRRLSPEEHEEKSIEYTRSEDDKPLVPIARSYKKFTFTKDGACITETKKVYATPGADGSWTKVEKKTTITTRPGNAEEFEKFRDLHLRDDSPLARSDSQSSSGSTDIYDDIFDSWTGDAMLCNMMKMKDVFRRFSRDPFLRSERKRNPFRQFRRTESERNERDRKRPELRSGHSTDKESSDNDEDYDVHFDGANPVVYGSQGLWQFLRSSSRGFPGHVTVTQREPKSYSRSVSQERQDFKYGNWKRSDSRTSSGYNTGTRSHSRERTASPREKVLRFVFEAPHRGSVTGPESRSPPKNESYSFKRAGCRNLGRDSGAASDGYESEHSLRHPLFDEVPKLGRISPMSSTYRRDMIRNFKKAWPDEFVSPPMSPSSLRQEAVIERPDNTAESRRHRVEQWLHMSDINDPNFPFDISDELHSRTPSRNSPSSIYGTMRPREYMRYNRSASDKIADFDCFPTFEESQRSRSIHDLHSKDPGFSSSGSRMRAKTVAYSPVSEESRETQSLLHSDSSHSNSSVHRINFTISDGRVSSSQTPSHSARYVHSFSCPGDSETAPDSNSSNIKVAQIQTKGQPFVQMRVSFNRDNRENQVIHLTSQPPHTTSKGLWQHQEHSGGSPLLQETSPPVREASPIPGIRKFSTEVVHPISSASDTDNSTTPSNVRKVRTINIEQYSQPQFRESERSNLGKDSSDSLLKGKNDACVPYLMCDPATSNACTLPGMENANMGTTNLNVQPQLHSATTTGICARMLTNKLHMFELQDGSEASDCSFKKHVSNGANTPDSLEDASVDIPFSEMFDNASYQKDNDHQNTCVRKSPLSTTHSGSSCILEIKPLGVLWDKQKVNNKVGEKNFGTHQVTSHSIINDNSEAPILQENANFVSPSEKYVRNSDLSESNHQRSKVVGKSFDVINSLLSNNGLDSFTSTKWVQNSSRNNTCGNMSHNRSLSDSTNTSVNFKSTVIPQAVLENNISVIENFECSEIHRKRFHQILPSLMDDLQSPKEVLREAMKLCDSLDGYK